jgi:NAD-dependent SIR2 family protein deacetylase
MCLDESKNAMAESGAAIDRAGDPIRRLFEDGSVVVLTGAGLSTSSGIPDYRDGDGQWKRTRPIDHRDFLRSESTRRRYWARSFVGWPTIALASPSRGHHALAELERLGRIDLIITQNVDGLHQRAGSRCVLELHGGLERVICLCCHRTFRRASVQTWMSEANPVFTSDAAVVAPDGDAQVAERFHADFRIPACPSCGGLLKPDVVFFGDSVPRDRVRAGMDAIAAARGLLVVGSSLMVYSGFRFAEHAHRLGKPVMAINLGTTRADRLLYAKVQEDCDQFLHTLQIRATVSAEGPEIR